MSYELLEETRDSISIVPIPKSENDSAFRQFCAKWGITYIGGGRRGYLISAETYIRSSTHLVLYDGRPIDVT